MGILASLYKLITSVPGLINLLLYAGVILFLFLYSFSRRNRWRQLLGRSLDYHRFHLMALMNDKNSNEKSREMYQALLWAVNKQLPDDLSRSKGSGSMVLWRSFIGDKTCVNTCGTVFYETARNYSFVDPSIIKLNDTLISVFYRILLLESPLSPVALLYMDLRLLLSLITRPVGGTGRLYREMFYELRSSGDN